MKKGFTLVELLGVIVLLGVIILVAAPSLIRTNKTAKANEQKDFEATLQTVCESYLEVHSDTYYNVLTMNGSSKLIRIQDLITEGYLKADLKNPQTTKTISEEQKALKATNSGNGIICEYVNNGATINLKKTKINWPAGITFNYKDYTAMDASGNDLTSQVKTDFSQINVNAPGRYVATYSLNYEGTTITEKQYVIISSAATNLEEQFEFTGSEQTFIVPQDGNYIITAAGAHGTFGNRFNYNGTTKEGGQGAVISGTFNLNKGDILTIIVGGQGSITQAIAKDGTSGAGGGGTFIFKQVSALDNAKANYQFTKNSSYYEILLVAAGGGGANDTAYNNAATQGCDGIATTFISPANFTAYSSEATTGLSSTVLGINQFIKYDLVGSEFTKNSGVCQGGYGGGGCSDNTPSYGGGWSGNSYCTNSFSSGSNTAGSTGGNAEANGYVTILKQ